MRISFVILASAVLALTGCDWSGEGLGDTCVYDSDCTAMVGARVFCGCEAGSPGAPRCQADLCGGIVCGTDKACWNDACVPAMVEGEACAAAPCAKGLFCNEGGLCESPRALGQPCSYATYYGADCQMPNYCEPSSQLCAAPVPFGEACSGEPDPLGRECAVGKCSHASGTCVDPQPNGSPCADDAECLSGSCRADTAECATLQCG